MNKPHIWMWVGSTSQSSRVMKEEPKDENRADGEADSDRMEKGEKGRDEDKAEFNGKAISLKVYIMKRRFYFLHLYSGPQDPLGTAIQAAAKRHRMKVSVTSYDKELNNADLLDPEPFGEILNKAKEGYWDGYHSGFPCTSFTKLRWRKAEGYPGPCRSIRYPYGLPTNDWKLQGDCDEGTLHASRSAFLGETILKAKTDGRIKPAVTMENPPPSAHEEHLSAWELPEIASMVYKNNLTKAVFPTCRYQSGIPAGKRTYKPQQFAGTLLGLKSMEGECQCGKGAEHIPVVGKERSVESGHYPQELCEKYAELLLQHFRRIATSEFYVKRAEDLKEEVDDLKKRSAKRQRSTSPPKDDGGSKSPEAVATSSKSKPQPKKEEDEYTYEYETDEGEDTKVTAVEPEVKTEDKPKEWVGGSGHYGMLKESKAKANDPANLKFLGGMRNPADAVAGMPSSLNLGLRIFAAWERFSKSNPVALETAGAYGTKDCTLDKGSVTRWKGELRKLIGSQGKPKVDLTSRWVHKSPLEADIIRAWTRKAGDPDTVLADWIEDGTPLGINLDIETKGVFPPSDKEFEEEVMIDASLQIARGSITNYSSITENITDSKEEVTRVIDLGYAVKLTREEVDKHFSQGTISKLAIIVKTRADGSKKRRLIIDLRRSGGNSKARLKEKIILPKAMDAVETIRAMHHLHPTVTMEEKRSRWGRELVLIDIQDAFPHLAVHAKELEHCLTPDVDGSGFLLFRALLFGFKTAPLLWSRYAAWVSRMLQSCVPPHEGQHQTYLDDSAWCLQGTLQRRNLVLGFILHTLAAIGMKVSVAKGERGANITWAGVEFRLISDKEVLVTLPEKFIADLQQRLAEWEGRGMAPLADLRAVTGKISWLSGVLPRTRWILRVFYAVMSARETEVRSGSEASRREKRTDTRNKDGLFVTKRLEGARLALMEYLNVTKERPTRKIPLSARGLARVNIITDASPEGLGAVLVINDQVIDMVASKVTEVDAKNLGFEWGSSASQGVVEALAIIVALKHWGPKLAGMNVQVTIKSDSVTALSSIQKRSGASAAQNFCGAVLGVLLERFRVEDAKLQHIPGVANKVADYLSRPSTWGSTPRPAEIKEGDISQSQVRDAEYFPLPPPGLNPELWGQTSEDSPAGPWTSWHS